MNVSYFITSLLDQLMAQMVYILPVLVLVTLFKSRWFKGKLGEFLVNTSAKLRLDDKIYHLIKNVTLPTEDGTTQIDHIIVSIYGVFVIETKNMKGWIFGGKDQRTWTQKIFKESHKFQNPRFQNYKHTQTLKELLQLNDQQIHSVIAFMGEATFKTEMPENVTQGGGYVRYIKSKITPVLTESEVKAIIEKIEQGRLISSWKTDRAHVAHLNEKSAERMNQNLCPKCGAVMVLREVKKGENAGKQFWGCTGYPRCRGVREYSDSISTQ